MKYALLLVFFHISIHVHAQDFDLEAFIDENIPIPEEDFDYESIYEPLFLRLSRPLNLNQADHSDLLSLHLLTPNQIIQLLDYREKYGPLIEIYELQAIPEFDLETIRKILPFITVESTLDVTSLLRSIPEAHYRQLIIRSNFRIQKAEGFRLADYPGDRNQLYTRFKWSEPGQFSFGITAEKDAGEILAFNDSIKGFDFYSYHAQFRNQGLLQNLVLGDHQIQFGQGLVFGAGFGLAKGAETITTLQKGNMGIRPYTSAQESGFFRGAGLTLGNDKLNTTLSYSHLKNDARLNQDTSLSEYEVFITSIQQTGLHRTPNEFASRNTITEQNVGINLNYEPHRLLNFGVNHLSTLFSIPIEKRPNVYNQFAFEGNQNHNSSIYGSGIIRNISLFAEVAISSSGGMGKLLGAIIPITSSVDFSALYRSFDRNFHSFYGNAFSEGSRLINEEGFYSGIKFKPSKQHQVTAYYDFFRFPWLKFRVDQPSNGNELLTRYTLQPSRSKIFYIQYRVEQKQRSAAEDGSPFGQTRNVKKQNIILNADYAFQTALTMKTRIQWSQFAANQTSTGIALIQDINLKILKWKIGTRMALFRSDDFENRQYVYEKDVLYAFSIPAYQGAGIRNYLLVNRKLGKNVRAWVRYSTFNYFFNEEIGTGLDRIGGSLRSDLKVQFIWNL